MKRILKRKSRSGPTDRHEAFDSGSLLPSSLTSCGMHPRSSEPVAPLDTQVVSETSSSQPDNNEEHLQPNKSTQRDHDSSYWMVKTIDDNDVVQTERLQLHDLWTFPSSRRVILHWNEHVQPIGEGARLLASFIESVGRNYTTLPLNYPDWKNVPLNYKEIVMRNTIQPKFIVNTNQERKYILKKIGNSWKNGQLEFYRARNNGIRLKEEIKANVPAGTTREHWASYVEMRYDPCYQENAKKKKNKVNRQRQTLNHTGKTKSLTQREVEMVPEHGRLVSRAELWTATNKKKDGSIVSNEARAKSEKISMIELQGTTSNGVSSQNSLVMA